MLTRNEVYILRQLDASVCNSSKLNDKTCLLLTFNWSWLESLNFSWKHVLHWRGIEPRSPAWQARILPLNHQCDVHSLHSFGSDSRSQSPYPNLTALRCGGVSTTRSLAGQHPQQGPLCFHMQFQSTVIMLLTISFGTCFPLGFVTCSFSFTRNHKHSLSISEYKSFNYVVLACIKNWQ